MYSESQDTTGKTSDQPSFIVQTGVTRGLHFKNGITGRNIDGTVRLSDVYVPVLKSLGKALTKYSILCCWEWSCIKKTQILPPLIYLELIIKDVARQALGLGLSGIGARPGSYIPSTFSCCNSQSWPQLWSEPAGCYALPDLNGFSFLLCVFTLGSSEQ